MVSRRHFHKAFFLAPQSGSQKFTLLLTHSYTTALTSKTIYHTIPENSLFCHRPVNVHIDIHTVLWQHLVVSYFATLRGEETKHWNCHAHKQKWQFWQSEQREKGKFQHWLIDATRLVTCLFCVHHARAQACLFQHWEGHIVYIVWIPLSTRRQERWAASLQHATHCSSDLTTAWAQNFFLYCETHIECCPNNTSTTTEACHAKSTVSGDSKNFADVRWD